MEKQQIQCLISNSINDACRFSVFALALIMSNLTANFSMAAETSSKEALRIIERGKVIDQYTVRSDYRSTHKNLTIIFDAKVDECFFNLRNTKAKVSCSYVSDVSKY